MVFLPCIIVGEDVPAHPRVFLICIHTNHPWMLILLLIKILLPTLLINLPLINILLHTRMSIHMVFLLCSLPHMVLVLLQA
jgi:hypothetical protein